MIVTLSSSATSGLGSETAQYNVDAFLLLIASGPQTDQLRQKKIDNRRSTSNSRTKF